MTHQQQQKDIVIPMIKRSTMKMLEVDVKLRALSSALDAADSPRPALLARRLGRSPYVMNLVRRESKC
jgi:hypothetical protein